VRRIERKQYHHHPTIKELFKDLERDGGQLENGMKGKGQHIGEGKKKNEPKGKRKKALEANGLGTPKRTKDQAERDSLDG